MCEINKWNINILLYIIVRYCYFIVTYESISNIRDKILFHIDI